MKASVTLILARTVYSYGGIIKGPRHQHQSASFSLFFSTKKKKANMNWDDRQHFHLLFFISVAEEIGCQKSLPTFYQAMTFNTLYPHKCELFREKKTKVPSTVALLSPAAYRHQSHPRDTNSTLVWQEQSSEVEKLKIWIFKKNMLCVFNCEQHDEQGHFLST